MAGFADLVLQAQPALIGGGCAAMASAGRTWEWRFTDIADNAGDSIDLTAAVGVCGVVEAPGGTEVLSLDVTGGDGELIVTADEAATADLYTGTDAQKGRQCWWYLTLELGGDSVQVWMVDNSPFNIRRGA